MLRFFQFLALLLVARYVFRSVAQWLTEGTERQRVGGSRGSNQPVYGGQMVRDPVCGLFLLRDSAIEESVEGETHHFCSNECREAFRSSKASRVPGSSPA